MSQKFLSQMISLGYTEAEAQTQWDQAMARADASDPVYTAMSAMYPDEAAAREEFALNQIEGLTPKSGGSTSISADPMKSDVGGGSSLQTTGTSSAKSSVEHSSKYTPPSIDNDQLRQQMNETVNSLLAEKHKKTAVTSISKVLVKTPDPSTFLTVNGVPRTVTISTDMAKIEKFEASSSVEQKPENVEAYRSLKAAAEGKTPVPVYINDENNRRIIGVVINTIGGDGQQTTMTLSAKALEAFLLGQVSGIITNGQAYVRLANWKKKTRMDAGQASTTMSLTVQWAKKGYFWENNLVDPISAPMTMEEAAQIGVPSPYESRTVKTAKSFVVVEPNPNPATAVKNPTRKRTIRFSGPCEEFPRFKIKPEYEEAGLSIGTSSTFISPNMTAAEAAKYDEQFAALVKGYMSGERFEQIDAIAEYAPAAYSKLLALRQSAQTVGAGASDGM
jgi:hypothetical protein